MVDNGFSIRQTEKRLSRLGASPDQICAILVTHEHADHCSGVAAFAGRYAIPVWASHGTSMAMNNFDVQCFDSHQNFEIEDFLITPVAVPHDAREPTQFILQCGRMRLGILTDIGSITAHVREAYAGCHGLLLECNYDPSMLRDGPYPPALKKRVDGDWGHLSNLQAADLLDQIDQSALQCLVLGHLSEKNNHPDRVRAAIPDRVQNAWTDIHLAHQEHGFDWITLRESVPSQEEHLSCCS